MRDDLDSLRLIQIRRLCKDRGLEWKAQGQGVRETMLQRLRASAPTPRAREELLQRLCALEAEADEEEPYNLLQQKGKKVRRGGKRHFRKRNLSPDYIAQEVPARGPPQLAFWETVVLPVRRWRGGNSPS